MGSPVHGPRRKQKYMGRQGPLAEHGEDGEHATTHDDSDDDDGDDDDDDGDGDCHG